MASAGVGIDLVEVERLERALERRPRLAQRLFTEAELTACAKRRRPAMHLAARFAAKEAAAKALELSAWSPRDVGVIGGGRSAPKLELAGAAARAAAARGVELQVSLSHTRDHAIACVAATPELR